MDWTRDFKRMKWLGLCPHCRAFHLALPMHASDGSKLPWVTPMWCLRERDYCLCKRCGRKVAVFEDQGAGVKDGVKGRVKGSGVLKWRRAGLRWPTAGTQG